MKIIKSLKCLNISTLITVLVACGGAEDRCTDVACPMLSELDSASLIEGGAIKIADGGLFSTEGTWDPASTPQVTGITGTDVATLANDPPDTEVFFDADATTTFDADYVYTPHTAFIGSYDYVQTYLVTFAGTSYEVYSGYHGIVTSPASMPTGDNEGGSVEYTGKAAGRTVLHDAGAQTRRPLIASSLVSVNFTTGLVNVTLDQDGPRDTTNHYFPGKIYVTGLVIDGNSFTQGSSTTFTTSNDNGRYTGGANDRVYGQFFGWDNSLTRTNAGPNSDQVLMGGPAEIAGVLFTTGDGANPVDGPEHNDALAIVFVAN